MTLLDRIIVTNAGREVILIRLIGSWGWIMVR
jgi:hypothetical protein